MTRRTVVFYCTLLSIFGILFSVLFIGALIFDGLPSEGSFIMPFRFTPIIYLIAWILYFYICDKWVQRKTISGRVKFLGCLFGFASIVCSLYMFAFMLAAPAILLMCYICFNDFESEEAAKNPDTSNWNA